MIEQITVKNFQAFEAFELNEPPAVNLLIGSNDTGKTGLLKVIYAVCKSWEEFGKKQKARNEEPFKELITGKLQNVFVKNIGDLVKNGGREKLSAEFTFDNTQNIAFSFGEKAQKQLECNSHIKSPAEDFNAIFIPAKEVLSIFHAIESSRESLFIRDFDDTYLDLVKSLKIPTQKGNIHRGLSGVNTKLSELFDGEIKQETKGTETNFSYRKKGNQKFPMGITAEGIKKIGVLTTLIRNREITPGTVLFLDEPDATLHPNAIRELAEIIYAISKEGTQVFLSTHNYFMIKQLSIIAKRESQKMNCISLARTEDKKSVVFQLSDLQDGLPENSIVEEALKMFDDEIEIDLQ